MALRPLPPVQVPDMGARFQQGMQTGQRNALAQLVQQHGVTDPRSINALAALDPVAGAKLGMQIEDRQIAAGQRQEAESRRSQAMEMLQQEYGDNRLLMGRALVDLGGAFAQAMTMEERAEAQRLRAIAARDAAQAKREGADLQRVTAVGNRFLRLSPPDQAAAYPRFRALLAQQNIELPKDYAPEQTGILLYALAEAGVNLDAPEASPSFDEQYTTSLSNAMVVTGEGPDSPRTREVAAGMMGVDLPEAAAAGAPTPADLAPEEMKLRKEYQGNVAATNDVLSAYAQIRAAADTRTGAGDIALVTSFMKLLDPASVVRESEFAQAANIGGIVDGFWSIINGVLDGAVLTDSQRRGLVQAAGQVAALARTRATSLDREYERLASAYGFDPSRVVFGRGGGEAATSAGTATRAATVGPPGTRFEVRDGFPDPASNAGVVIRDEATGEVFRSDGSQWTRVEQAPPSRRSRRR